MTIFKEITKRDLKEEKNVTKNQNFRRKKKYERRKIQLK